MASVMLGEQQLVLPIEIGGTCLEPLADKILLEQFFLEPQWQGHAERGEPARRKSEVGLEQPFELHKGLLVENDVIELVKRQTALVDTIPNGILSNAPILLFAAKPPFLLH